MPCEKLCVLLLRPRLTECLEKRAVCFVVEVADHD